MENIQRSGRHAPRLPESGSAGSLIQEWILKLDGQILATDRRNARRRPYLRLPRPVRLHRLGEPRVFEALVEDITCEGFYCNSPELFAPSEEVQCDVIIAGPSLGPPLGATLILRCRAEVLRTVADWHVPGYGIDFQVLDCKVLTGPRLELLPLPKPEQGGKSGTA